MNYNKIDIKLITKNTDEAPEYASYGVSANLIFTAVIGDATEMTVKVYNSKMQLMGATTGHPVRNRNTHRIHLDIFSALPWTNDIYTYIILRNGVARWMARVTQFTDMSWEEHGKIEEIMPDSKWMHFLTCWEQTKWWNQLSILNLDQRLITDLTDWIWRCDSQRGKNRRQSNCIFLLADNGMHKGIGTKVLPHFLNEGKSVHEIKLTEVLNQEVALGNLAQWVVQQETLAIDLSGCDTDWWYYDTACTLYGLISKSRSNAALFVLHGSADDLERLVYICNNFRDIAKAENTIALDGEPYFDYLPTCWRVSEEKVKDLLNGEDWGPAILKMLKE